MPATVEKTGGDGVVRDWMTLVAGQGLRMLLALGTSIIIARTLGPEGLGVFTTVSAVVAVLYTISDFGLSNAAVKFIASARQHDAGALPLISQSYFSLKVSTAFVVVALSLVAAKPLSTVLLKRPELAPFLSLGILGLFATSLNAGVSTFLQALKKFAALVRVQLLLPLSMLLVVAGLYVLQAVTVKNVILAGVVVPLVAFMAGWRELRRLDFDFIPAGIQSWKNLRAPATTRLLRFARWLWVVMLLSSLVAQMDLLLLNRLTSAENVGFYALALGIAFRFDVLNQSLLTVLLPGVSSLKGRGAFSHFVKSSFKRTVPLAGVILLSMIFVEPAVLFFYGIEYLPAVRVMEVLILVVAFDLVTSPVFLLAYPLDRPKTLALLDGVRLLVLVAGCFSLVPQFGLLGAAWSKLIAKGIAALLGFAIIFRVLKRADYVAGVNDSHRVR